MNTSKSSYTKLIIGTSYGRVAQDIYNLLCHYLSFDETQKSKFGKQQPLFASCADTDRTRDVWFICHSNYTDTVSENGKHVNKINGNVITEYYKESKYDRYPMNDRITFAKKRNQEYEFIGVFRPDDPYSKEENRRFTLISDIYPIE